MENKIPGRIRWSSYILQGIVSSFLFLGSLNNLAQTESALENAKALGYPENFVLPMAIALIIAILCYVVPKTSVLGALILTAWFGGAVATHIIHGDSPVFLVPPVIFTVLVWVALGLRDKRVQSLFFLKQ